MAAALFDLDSTLLDCNSASLWLRHEWKAGRVPLRTVVLGSWWILRYSMGHDIGKDVFERAVAMLRGVREAELEQRVADWFADDVAHRIRPGAHEALARHRAAGDRLVLATSSSPYVSRQAVALLNLDDYLCTSFSTRDGVFTGDIEKLAYGDAKADRGLEWAEQNGVSLADCAFYTDSQTDVRLMELVGKPVAVNPDRALAVTAAQRGWDIVDWGNSPKT